MHTMMNIKEYIHQHVSHKAWVYIGFWIMILLLPICGSYLAMSSRNVEQINWQHVCAQWVSLWPFALIFLVNCLWLVPRLFMRQRYAAYIASIAVLSFLAFTTDHLLVQHTLRPQHEMAEGRPEMDEERKIGEEPPEMGEGPRERPFADNGERQQFKPRRDSKPQMKHSMRFRRMMLGPFAGDMVLVLLMATFNIAVELFFKSQRDKEAILELRNNEVQTQLDYLKYQINPHFFMNTLNNIHALVDIDTEKAKETIVELSKLMRYLLYESDKEMIPLDKEVNFLQHYIELMRIRYPGDMVNINATLPSDTSNVMIPPMLFISFVENAFKHGVSYRSESYVNISLDIDNGRIYFKCSNSNQQNHADQHHGIGMENIKRRLELLYGSKYSLGISETEQEFNVCMSIPIIANL